MRDALRGFFILVFAGALVFNGGAVRTLTGVAAAHAHQFAATSVEIGHNAQHQTDRHVEPDSVGVALGQLPMHDHADSRAKCCSMCLAVGSLMPTFEATPVQFRYGAIVFKVGRQNLVGHLVSLDPDIPKTIV